MKKVFTLLTAPLAIASMTATESRPNILIIQCDHLAQRALSTYGGNWGCASVIDSIASQGVAFANAYVGCPLSQPSRAALWTGLMPHQNQVRSNSFLDSYPTISKSTATLGELFSNNGYVAAHFGKTHDREALRGFVHKEPVAESFIDPYFPVNGDSFRDVGTCKDVVGFLRNDSLDKPFICVADFENPHNICGFVGANEGEHIDKPIPFELPSLPDNFEVTDWDNLPPSIQYMCCIHRRMTQAAHWNETNYRYYIAAYQYYTRMVCKQIEQVMAALQASGKADNTIVVVLADHGDGLASHRMVTKFISFYDEMTNVPFIIAGKGIKRNEQPLKNLLVSPTLDLLPTLCDIAGIDVPSDKKGISLLPVLKGEKNKNTHPYVVSEWHSSRDLSITPGRMIRSKQYKYTHYLEKNAEELYDLLNDPGEKHNLAKDKAYNKVLKEHRSLLADYIKKTNDDYFSLEVKVDPKYRNHQPGYSHHMGEGSKE